MLVYSALPRIPSYFDTLEHDKQLVQVGAYLDDNTTGLTTVIALDYRETSVAARRVGTCQAHLLP